MVAPAGFGGTLVQVLTSAGRGSLPSPCTELTPWGTLSTLQVCPAHTLFMRGLV